MTAKDASASPGGAQETAPAAAPSADEPKSLWVSWPYIVVWMSFSIGVIFMNSAILRRVPNPASLTAWHMAISSVLVHVLRRFSPQDSIFAAKQEQKISANIILTKFVPIAFLFALALALGNRAYMYLSVSFIQMIKASHSVVVYTLSTLVGVEVFLRSKFKLVCVVYIGVTLAVTGELQFQLIGFLCQVFSSLSECSRVVLIGLLLNKNGLKLDALTALSYYAPLCFLFLVPAVVLTEMPSDIHQWSLLLQNEIGFAALLLNGCMAFSLNVATVLLIQKTSPILFILCGIMKDVLIITFSVCVLGSAITVQQVLGYSMALMGIQVFNLVPKMTDTFERDGVIATLVALVRQRFQKEERSPATIDKQ